MTSTSPGPHTDAPQVTSARRLRRAGIGVLVIGLLAAAWIYWTAASAVVDPVAESAAAQTAAREMQQVERLGGKATVLTVQFHQWLQSLMHGRPLAITLALLSTLIAFTCVRIAGLMGEDTGAD